MTEAEWAAWRAASRAAARETETLWREYLARIKSERLAGAR